MFNNLMLTVGKIHKILGIYTKVDFPDTRKGRPNLWRGQPQKMPAFLTDLPYFISVCRSLADDGGVPGEMGGYFFTL